MKKLLTGVAALPLLITSCGGSENITFENAVLNAVRTEQVLHEKNIETKSSPIMTTDGNKKIIKIGMKNWYKDEDKYSPKDENNVKTLGGWKFETVVKNSSQRALLDIINNFNSDPSKTYKIEPIELSVKDLNTKLQTLNSEDIPHLYYGGYDDVITLTKYNNLMGKINNTGNKLGMIDVLNQTEYDVLPINVNPLISVVDFKLMNGLICGYNKAHNKGDVQIMELSGLSTKKCSDVIGNTTAEDELFTSKGYDDSNPNNITDKAGVNNNLFELGQKLPASISNEALSYESFKNDSNIALNIVKEYKNIQAQNKAKYFMGSSFLGQTIRALSNVKYTDNKLTNTSELNNISSLLINAAESGFRSKDETGYNTQFVNDSNIVFDVTKGFSLNYYLESKNLIAMNTPGFTYNDISGFGMLTQKTEEVSVINQFIEDLFTGSFASGSHLVNNAEDHKTDVMALSPLEYYSFWAKTKPITETAKNSVININNTLFKDYFKFKATHKNIFDVFNETRNNEHVFDNQLPYDYSILENKIELEFNNRYAKA